jgi:hypothetical protein
MFLTCTNQWLRKPELIYPYRCRRCVWVESTIVLS